jgi:hypothetical protein
MPAAARRARHARAAGVREASGKESAGRQCHGVPARVALWGFKSGGSWMLVLLDEARSVMSRLRGVRRGSLTRAPCGGMARTAGKDDRGPRAVVVDRSPALTAGSNRAW